MPLLKQKGQSGEEGQGLAEYALIIVLVAVVVIVILSVLGPAVGGLLGRVNAALNGGIAIVESKVVNNPFPELHVTVVVIEEANVTLDPETGSGVTKLCTANESCTLTTTVGGHGTFTVSTDSGAEASGAY